MSKKQFPWFGIVLLIVPILAGFGLIAWALGWEILLIGLFSLGYVALTVYLLR